MMGRQMKTLYRVESLTSEDMTFPVTLSEALDQIHFRAPKEKDGSLRIRRVDYQLPPEEPPGIHTNAAQRIWRATILRFPDIGYAGCYVCKPDSQHRYGNAIDWVAPPSCDTSAEIIRYLSHVAEWTVAEAKQDLPVTQVIWRYEIWTPAAGWHPYTGDPHYSHVHDSGPLIPTSRPCGEI